MAGRDRAAHPQSLAPRRHVPGAQPVRRRRRRPIFDLVVIGSGRQAVQRSVRRNAGTVDVDRQVHQRAFEPRWCVTAPADRRRCTARHRGRWGRESGQRDHRRRSSRTGTGRWRRPPQRLRELAQGQLPPPAPAPPLRGRERQLGLPSRPSFHPRRLSRLRTGIAPGGGHPDGRASRRAQDALGPVAQHELDLDADPGSRRRVLRHVQHAHHPGRWWEFLWRGRISLCVIPPSSACSPGGSERELAILIRPARGRLESLAQPTRHLAFVHRRPRPIPFDFGASPRRCRIGWGE